MDYRDFRGAGDACNRSATVTVAADLQVRWHGNYSLTGGTPSY